MVYCPYTPAVALHQVCTHSPYQNPREASSRICMYLFVSRLLDTNNDTDLKFGTHSFKSP